MRLFLTALALLAITSSTSQAAGSERAPPKRHVQSVAAAQTGPSDRMALSRKVDSGPQFTATSDFRAEKLIPDICRGCSS